VGPDRRTDAELLAATRTDETAFVAFYDRYERGIVGYFARRVADREAVADLTAEVFAAALGAAPRYRSSQPTAANWLFTIAHNTLTKSLRSQQVQSRARRKLGITEAVRLDADELDRVETLADSDHWLTDLLDRLPSDQAKAVRARVLDERSYPQIAAELKTSELVIRKRVSRGLTTLRSHIGKEKHP
jgi:RNA polymerase sigma factor (sigma-70 family)